MRWVSLLFLMISQSALGAETFNAGFVQGLWYDRDTFFVGDTVRVYVAVRNNTGADLTGRVEFYDSEALIERNNISALNGRIIESWADWKPSYGEHTLTATLSRIELHAVGSSTEAIEVTSALAKEVVFVDYDTDGDGIGNSDDRDDDGDGWSDADEKENGTDPLDPSDPEPEPEEQEDDTENVVKEGEDGEDDASDATTSEPEGLEQFLTESRADSVLSSVTNVVNSAKQDLDTFRDKRSERRTLAGASASFNNASSSTSTTTTVEDEEYADGFGEVSRTNENTKTSVLASFANVLKSLIYNLVTLVLFLLSLYLSHPVIVQLSLLLLILFLVYKLARRMGARGQ